MDFLNETRFLDITLGGNNYVVLPVGHDVYTRVLEQHQEIATSKDWVTIIDKIEDIVLLLFAIDKDDQANDIIGQNASVIDMEYLMTEPNNRLFRLDPQRMDLYKSLYGHGKIDENIYAYIQLTSGMVHDEEFFDKYLEVSGDASWVSKIGGIVVVNNRVVQTILADGYLLKKYINSELGDKQIFIKGLCLDIFALSPAYLLEFILNEKLEPNDAITLATKYISSEASWVDGRPTFVDVMLKLKESGKVSLTNLSYSQDQYLDLIRNKELFGLTDYELLAIALYDDKLISYIDVIKEVIHITGISRLVTVYHLKYIPYLTTVSDEVKDRFILAPIMFNEAYNAVYDTVTDTIWTMEDHSAVAISVEEYKEFEYVKEAMMLKELTSLSEGVCNAVLIKRFLQNVEAYKASI